MASEDTGETPASPAPTGTAKVEGKGGTADPVDRSKQAKPLPPSAKKPLPPSAKKKVAAAQRSTAPAGAASTRYTPPTTREKRGPSPRWVPVLMFVLWVVGLLLIVLNYMGVLPGSADTGNGWYLVAGLGLILGGIITATQYR